MSKENMKDTAPTKLRNLSDDVLQSAEEAVKATHDKADQLFDAAEDGVRQLRAEASPVIQDLAARAQENSWLTLINRDPQHPEIVTMMVENTKDLDGTGLMAGKMKTYWTSLPRP